MRKRCHHLDNAAPWALVRAGKWPTERVKPHQRYLANGNSLRHLHHSTEPFEHSGSMNSLTEEDLLGASGTLEGFCDFILP